ncbi:topoisomerase II-associated protein PAT1 [Bombardia bombarda]|uniref:Topoisomerase II-associated protein PAT1 n=1 Tax=Bombardia bombarda TaxID=252184 RepID=A0AA39XNC7_9PEZI|nr:topoisomerase II-associated protein PAT1 [Bombardia bombarda]
MSFFGFDTPRHNPAATGFSQVHNPFAGLSGQDNEGEALEFEDTYDGLGDQLEETNDAFNDDTFGDDSAAVKGPVGKDFDFFGQTAKVSNAIEEEHVRFQRQVPTARVAQSAARVAQQPFSQTVPAAASYNYPTQSVSKPARSGYEKYSQEPVEELQVDAALWGVAPKKHTAPAPAPAPTAVPAPTQTVFYAAAPSSAPAGRKILSLEEVEAQMRAQAKRPLHQAASSPAPPQPQVQLHQAHPQMHYEQSYQYAHPVQPQVNAQADDLRPKEHSYHLGQTQPQPVYPAQTQPVMILQRPQSKHAPSPQPPIQHSVHQRQQSATPAQPTQILQNPNRLSGDAAKLGIPSHPTPPTQINPPTHPVHRQQDSFHMHPSQMMVHPSLLGQFSEEDKVAYLDQEAKRAKRNHKIYQMSRDNGIMTPQDKNFITRIQLQQLVAATGNPNEHGTDEAFAEDFYYQVHNQIQGGHRQHPSQPLNNFAQTYLFQTGSRQGGLRRQHRGPENHMQRMEQQVQRAVEAAKNKPKNKQLVIEGSLGKISFSNAKTPKPLLNIKRNDSASEANRPGSAHRTHTLNGRDRKSELRSIELVYTTLMKMEDHDRIMPPRPANDIDTKAIHDFIAWNNEAQALNQQLWKALRVHDRPDSNNVHPFIALLSYSKGMKAMQRIFRRTSQEQRITILTLIVVNFDTLDVVRNAQATTGEMQLNAAMRENVELFSASVMSTLFNIMNELELNLVAGVLGLVCSRNVDVIAKSRIGVAMLTMILSRAEIIKQSSGGTADAWHSWDATYMQFFNLLEPTLPHVFPGTVNSGDDIYVWQFLAAIGIEASPDQQSRLVLAVKDRVMDTVTLAKTLPQDLATPRLQNVNLFMRSIGLDVELLQ